jgi:hypothetical protein
VPGVGLGVIGSRLFDRGLVVDREHGPDVALVDEGREVIVQQGLPALGGDREREPVAITVIGVGNVHTARGGQSISDACEDLRQAIATGGDGDIGGVVP